MTSMFDDASVRAALFAPAPAPPPSIYLHHLGAGLDREGPPLPGGVTPDRLAEVLHVHALESWNRDPVKNRSLRDCPYGPMAALPNADGKSSRTFLPEDLTEAEQAPLRALAQASNNAIVKARIFDVMWVRFRDRRGARDSVAAMLAAQALHDGNEGWPELVRLLVRASQLVGMHPGSPELPDIIAAIQSAGERLLSGRYPFGFAKLAEGLACTLLDAQWTRTRIGSDILERWATTLEWLASSFHAQSEWFHGRNALEVLELWNARRGAQPERHRIQRLLVERLLEEAHARQPGVAPQLLREAVGLATDWGVTDLREKARVAMEPAIQAATSRMKQYEHAFELPKQLLDWVREMVATAPNPTVAFLRLAATPDLTLMPVAALEATAQQQRSEFLLRSLLPSTRFRKLKIAFQACDPAEKQAEAVADNADMHLLVIEHLLVIALRTIFQDDVPADALLQTVLRWPYLRRDRVPLLACASERFAANDWVSSGVLVATLYEGILRDLARARGLSPLKVDQGGLTTDETLAVLLRRPGVRSLLGEDHAWFVEYLLCEPQLGPNLRNEVAHGNVTENELTPSRVLLVWLFIIRLTFVATGPGIVEAIGPERGSSADVAESSRGSDDAVATTSDHNSESVACTAPVDKG